MLFRETIRIVLKPFNAFVVQDFEIVTKRLDSQQTRVAEILGVVVARLNDVDEKVTQHTVQLSGIQEALGRIEERLSGL